MALLLGLSSKTEAPSRPHPSKVLTEAVASWLEPRLQFALDDGFAAGDREIQKDPDAARECAVAASALVAHIVASDLALQGLAKGHPAAAELLEEAARSEEPAREGAELYQRLRELPAGRLEGGALMDPTRRSVVTALALFALAILLMAGVEMEDLRSLWSATAAAGALAYRTGALAYRAGGVMMPYAMPLGTYVVGIMREYVRDDMIPLLTAPATAYDVFANVTGSESLTSAAGNLAQELRCVAEYGLSCEGIQRSEEAFGEGYGGFGDLAECLVGNNAEGFVPQAVGAATASSAVFVANPAVAPVALAALAGAAAGRMSSCGAGRVVDYALDAVDQVADGISLGPFVPGQYMGQYQQRLAEHRAQQRELWQTMLALYVPLAYMVFIQPTVARYLPKRSFIRRATNWTVAMAPTIMGYMLWALSVHDQTQLAARQIVAPLAGTSSPGSSVMYARRNAIMLFQRLINPLASIAMAYTLNEGIVEPSPWLPERLRRRLRARDGPSGAVCRICFHSISARLGRVEDWWREEQLREYEKDTRERNEQSSHEIAARTGSADEGRAYLAEATRNLERLLEVSRQDLCSDGSCAAVRTQDGLHYHVACLEAATGRAVRDGRLFCPIVEEEVDYTDVGSDRILSRSLPQSPAVPSAADIVRDVGEAAEEYNAMVEEAGARGIDRFEDASARVGSAIGRVRDGARRAGSAVGSAVEYAGDQAIRMRRLLQLAQSALAEIVPEIVGSAKVKLEEEIGEPLPEVEEDSVPEPPSPPVPRRSPRLRNRR